MVRPILPTTMSHKGRCFRDRRKTKRRKLRQILFEIREVIKPTIMHIPQVAEIPLPPPEIIPPEVYAKVQEDVRHFGTGFYKTLPDGRIEHVPPEDVIVVKGPEKEVSFKRRSW